mmetsp:Transcript_43447/g.98186  ORF Transcript_43447/g.98186 Transcript_43447/m.98186 type:complete len:92 (-) Transcript_43447:194-469(-)
MSLSASTAYQTLFKMFLAMVIFGLAHGLVFLPCLIYLIALASQEKEKPSASEPREPGSGSSNRASRAGTRLELANKNEPTEERDAISGQGL